MSRQTITYTILNAKATTGAGIAIPCGEYRHAIFSFATDGGADAALTVKFQGSIGTGIGANMEVAPAFGSAQSVTNQWDYLEVIDLQNGNAIDGDTGMTVAGVDDYRLFEAQINGMQYICATVTARTQGEVTITVRLYND